MCPRMYPPINNIFRDSKSKEKSKEKKSRSSSSDRSHSEERSSSKEKKSTSEESSSPTKPGNVIYTMIAKQQDILAEFTSYTGNFTAVAVEALNQLDSKEPRVTVPHGDYTLHFLSDANFRE